MLLSRSAADTAVARRRLALIAAELADWSTTEQTPADGAGPSAPPPESPPEPPVGSPVGSSTTASTGLPSGRHAVRAGLPGRLAGRLADSLPATLRGRWGITAHHVTVIALLVATALAGATWWALQAQPEPVGALPETDLPSAAPTAGASTTDPASTSSGETASATAGPVLVVHVAGKVRRPGIVELPAGSRVIDALRAAGGARQGVDVSGLNLARPLADGEQIVVGPAPSNAGGAAGPSVPSSGSAPAGPALVNLNTATGAELEQLPGVGPVTASSILEWRTEHGRFSTVDELLEVSGIGEKTLAELRDLVTV